jgi:hypothetical protein
MQLEAPGTLPPLAGGRPAFGECLQRDRCQSPARPGVRPLPRHRQDPSIHRLFHGEPAQPGKSRTTRRIRAASARIVREHVTDGVDLALKHRLPRAVVDVIRQHHGTTLVRFFYNRAVSTSRPLFAGGDPPPVPESPYRYDGPKPQFKESAVISLADAVEAASRSLRSTTPEQLDQIIGRIVTERVTDGQLDEAPLTLEEIAKTKSSFTFTLLNMLHARVAYQGGDAAAEPGAEGQSRSGI